MRMSNALKSIRISLRAIMPQIEARYAVAELGIFGSIVRDEATPASDVDVLVAFNKTPTLFQFVRLQRELSECLKRPVDLVMKSALKPNIGQRILAEVIAI